MDEDQSTVAGLQKRLRDFRDEREWVQFHNLKNLAASISIEAAELQEMFLWAESEDASDVLQRRKGEVEAELADVLIQCLNFANVADIDPVDAILRKIDENALKYPVAKARGSSTKYTDL